MLKVYIIKGNTGYDVSNSFEKIVWSGRKGAAPRSCKLTLLDDDCVLEGVSYTRVPVDCENGDFCVVYEDDNELFRGMVISHKQNRKKRLTITAYDNAYSLANNKDSFCFTNSTATQIFNDLKRRLKLSGGTAVDTGYVIPELPKAKTTPWDVLLDALSLTYKATGRRYYISSSRGELSLLRRSENINQWVLEVGGNITDYEYTKSISGIKTRVRLLSKEDAVVYEKVNTELEKKIGMFAEVKSVDDDYNEAQMKELVQSVFAEKGIPSRSLKVSGIGITDSIAGGCVYVIIPHLGINRTFYIDEDTHTFNRHSHTMTLKLNFADDIDAAG